MQKVSILPSRGGWKTLACAARLDSPAVPHGSQAARAASGSAGRLLAFKAGYCIISPMMVMKEIVKEEGR